MFLLWLWRGRGVLRQQQRQAAIREMLKIDTYHTGIPDFQHSTLLPERWKGLLKHP